MDDQRCPLEEGQPGAAEATAAAALEERIGERPRRAPLGLEGSGAPGALAPKGGGHQLQSAPRHRELPAPASPGAASWGTCHLARPPERGVRLVSLGVGVGGQALLPSPPGGRAGGGGPGQLGALDGWGGRGGALPGLTAAPHSPALADRLAADRGPLRPHRQLPEPPAGRPEGQRGQPAGAARHPRQPGAPAWRRGPPGARRRVLQHAHQVPGRLQGRWAPGPQAHPRPLQWGLLASSWVGAEERLAGSAGVTERPRVVRPGAFLPGP